MAKYQSFLSRIGSNRDRAALRGIFSQFLTDDDPPALKDLVLASIILSGAETTQITISGASTTGILLSGASTTPISITGAFTTGINIAADGTTAIAVTSAFSGVNMISLAGTGSTSGILISGACGAGVSITGACTDGIKLATGAMTDGIEIASACTNGINLSGACTTGVSISGACTTGISITKAAALPLAIGTFSSATAGSGIVLSAAVTAAARIYADDGGAKLAAGEKRVAITRFLYATADTDATDQTMSAHVGQVKVAANLTIGGNLAGLCGYLEVAAGSTLIGGRAAQASVASAVWGRVDIPATGVIGTDAFVSAFAAGGNLGGTHTGKATVMHVPNPSAGGWDFFAVFGSAPGDMIAANTHTIDSHALSYVIKISDPAGNPGYIPVLAAVPS